MFKKHGIPNRLKVAVALRDKGICQNCGKEGFLGKNNLAYERKKELDPRKNPLDDSYRWIPMETSHIIPEFGGGKMILDNLILLCRYCNRSLGANTWIPPNASNNNT